MWFAYEVMLICLWASFAPLNRALIKLFDVVLDYHFTELLAYAA